MGDRIEAVASPAKYFFDTYAIIEIAEGNPRYEQYREIDFATARLNIVEFHYRMLRYFNEQTAEASIEKMWNNAVEFDKDTMVEANKFRLKNKSKKLSTTDCIGYIYALKHGMLFLTGDKEFEGLPHVEFVKKQS